MTCIGLWYVYWYGLLFDIYSTPLLCFNSSIERIGVNCDSSVMIGVRLHLTGGRHRKDFLKKYFFGRIAFYEHGGKTGMAMIKYPLYKKNNSRNFTLLYPGLTTVSL